MVQKRQMRTKWCGSTKLYSLGWWKLSWSESSTLSARQTARGKSWSTDACLDQRGRIHWGRDIEVQNWEVERMRDEGSVYLRLNILPGMAGKEMDHKKAWWWWGTPRWPSRFANRTLCSIRGLICVRVCESHEWSVWSDSKFLTSNMRETCEVRTYSDACMTRIWGRRRELAQKTAMGGSGQGRLTSGALGRYTPSPHHVTWSRSWVLHGRLSIMISPPSTAWKMWTTHLQLMGWRLSCCKIDYNATDKYDYSLHAERKLNSAAENFRAVVKNHSEYWSRFPSKSPQILWIF